MIDLFAIGSGEHFWFLRADGGGRSTRAGTGITQMGRSEKVA